MSYRFFLMITLALTVAFTAGACAENPADNVPAAEVSDVDSDAADETSAESDTDTMSDETEADEGSESADDADEADDAAADTDEDAAMAGDLLPLMGAISAVGSKVTGSHNLVFEDWTGTVDMGDGMPESVQLVFEVNMQSLATDPGNEGPMTERLDTHLRSEDFFSIEQFPNATFVSTSITEGGEGDATHTITGDLTLRGITKEIAFPATVTIGDDGVSATAEFAINRMDFDMVFTGQPDDLIREEVVLQIDIESTN